MSVCTCQKPCTNGKITCLLFLNFLSLCPSHVPPQPPSPPPPSTLSLYPVNLSHCRLGTRLFRSNMKSLVTLVVFVGLAWGQVPTPCGKLALSQTYFILIIVRKPVSYLPISTQDSFTLLHQYEKIRTNLAVICIEQLEGPGKYFCES